LALLAPLVLKDVTDNQVFQEKTASTANLDLQEKKASLEKKDQLVRPVHLGHRELVFLEEMVSMDLLASLASLVYQDQLVSQESDYQVLMELPASLDQKVQQGNRV